MTGLTAEEHATHRIRFATVVKDAKHAKNAGARLLTDSTHAQSIIWASERIAELEGQTQSPKTGSDETRDLFFRLGYGCERPSRTYCEAVAWGQDRIKTLEIENENLSKTILTLSNSPLRTSSDSGEEIHQRRRRERMLDEITISCVRSLLHLDAEQKSPRQIGASARDRAEDICHGIEEFDEWQ